MKIKSFTEILQESFEVTAKVSGEKIPLDYINKKLAQMLNIDLPDNDTTITLNPKYDGKPRDPDNPNEMRDEWKNVIDDMLRNDYDIEGMKKELSDLYNKKPAKDKDGIESRRRMALIMNYLDKFNVKYTGRGNP